VKSRLNCTLQVRIEEGRRGKHGQWPAAALDSETEEGGGKAGG
jgi:hypothetical protein